MNIHCPECGQEFEVPDQLAGKMGRCGACKAVFRMPKGITSGESDEDYGLEIPFETVVQMRPIAPRPSPPVREMPDPADEELEEPSALLPVLQFIADWAPGLFRPKIIIYSILCFFLALFLFRMSLFFMQLGAVLGAIPVAAFGLVCYAEALAMILVGEVGLLSSLLTELNGTRWMIFFVLLFTPIILFFRLVVWLSRAR